MSHDDPDVAPVGQLATFFWEAVEIECRYCGQRCRRYRPGSTFVETAGCVKMRRRVYLVAEVEIKTQADLDLIEERVHDEEWWERVNGTSNTLDEADHG